MNEKPVTVTVELPSEGVAWALAQFVKRLGWHGMAECSISGHETYLMCDGVDAVRRGLAEAGFEPR